MPRSSRHKSHKQSKHSSRDAKEQSESESDVKVKSRIDKDEASSKTRDSASSEKRKLSKDPSGDKLEEYVSSKRRKEKAEANSASDRWNGGGKERGDNVNTEKETKGATTLRVDEDKSSKSIVEIVDSKSRSSRRHENGSDKKEESMSVVVEKEENKTSSRGDSKRKSEKEKDVHQYKSSSKSKDKEPGLEKERIVQDNKRSTEARIAEPEVVKEQVSHLAGVGEKHQGKRSKESSKENTECLVQDDPPNPESEKELEKRTRKRRDGSNSKDKHQVDAKEIEDKRPSSRGERDKESKSKDEKHKDGSSRSNLHDDVSKGKSDDRHRDTKYQGDDTRDSRQKDTKYREDDNRGSKHKEDKHRGDGERDGSYRDDKYREEGDSGSRHRGDKYYEDGDRDNRLKENKFHEDSDRTYRQRGSKYREDGDRDDWHLDDGSRDAKKRDFSRDSRQKDGAHKDDDDSDKRHRGTKYLDERSARDRSGGKSDYKRLRDEKEPAELHYKRSNNRDGSPPFDDRGSAYKDDKSKRITNGKEEHDDGRSRSGRGNYYEEEKRSASGARVTLVNDRGRSSTRNADGDVNPNHSRRRNSPSSSSHAAKDRYRFSKQEDSKYSNYTHEERVKHDVSSRKEYGSTAVADKTSFSRPNEKSSGKDDLHLVDFSADRRHKSDARSSPLKIVDKSPSSTSADHRYLNRSDVRRSLDIEESGQRSGGSKDGKDYSSREGRGSRNLHMESHPGDEFSLADDNVSVSSPFTRSGHFSGHSRSLLPPPHPFRMGPDSPLALSSFEDDNRGKGNNRNRRMGDSNMGRMQGNSWRGVPNWPAPVANGFLPFQHGPPPIGFHPVMQQFPSRPLFGVRPSMELNQSGVPYHVPDGDGFPGHGLTHGWRNPVDEPPFIHGWDPNNAVFGNESHLYGNHNRNLASGRLWEANGDTWKGQSISAGAEFPSTPRKDDFPAHGQADEVLTNQLGLQTQNDQKQPNEQVGVTDIDQPGDSLEKTTFEAPRPTDEEMMNLSREDEARISHVYLTMLDISSDLAHPEVYSQYTNLMGIDRGTKCDDADPKFVLVEEGINSTLQSVHETPIASLFSTMDDSIFQKAMSLYKKLREEVGGVSEDKACGLNASSLESAQMVSACDEPEPEAMVSDVTKLQIEEVSPPKPDEITGALVPADEPVEDLHNVKIELDLVPKQEPLDFTDEDKSKTPENMEMLDAADSKAEEEAKSLEGHFCVVDLEKPPDAKCNPLLVSSDVSSTSNVACEAVMPESVESESVNLSRIHHQSPQSIH